MKNLLLFLLLISPFISQSQNSEPIITREQNSEWLTALEQQDLPGRLEMIRERWKEDAKFYYQVSTLPHGISKESKVVAKCRPLYIFNRSGKGQWIFPANPSSEVIAEVSKMLNPDNISEVKVETGIKMQAIYGQRGSCGVIIITMPENAVFDRLTSEGDQ